MTNDVSTAVEVDLDMIAEQVWSAFLNGGEEETVYADSDSGAGVELAASVAMVGAYEGHLVVSCSHKASRDVASVLFAMEPEEVTADDVGDALGELANVLGGNVKSVLPSPSQLSLPRVSATAHERWPGTVEVCRTVVRWRDEPYVVTLLSGGPGGSHNAQEA
ncbi:chemotaxis protein CheX [Actinokineospora terrae]|uniref:Chemotaxis protein CheX n=1 Tax=Actinokineospora terrae TaxID=155974 RepID=A0A1H9X0S0_9PSEU|nr:chemotaxis protein CheX [Actinokineospora terrae]SES39631.1 chemotaxis protein CheX [Actinokineospora terrae]